MDVIDELVIENLEVSVVEEICTFFDVPKNSYVNPSSEHIDNQPLENSQKSELRSLPDSLKYSFLGPCQTLPDIIASHLTLE